MSAAFIDLDLAKQDTVALVHGGQRTEAGERSATLVP
jgi:hypothetical protein